jgi:FtsP/CotA-like multicopper oxidase with cupredoxin domain
VRTVRVRGGAPVGEVRTLSYRRGDRIRLRITADAPDEVHVHGFDVEKPVGPGKPARFTIEADIEGRFEVELHGSGTQIATLEVRPKT